MINSQTQEKINEIEERLKRLDCIISETDIALSKIEERRGSIW